MKTPISYYGGKLNLVNDILPLIPQHVQYVEPFCGGAALFWAKRKSDHECINDLDLRISNFWQTCQSDFVDLANAIQNQLHHENDHSKAATILKSPMVDNLDYAWAFWVQSQMSFSHRIFGGFAFNNTPNRTGLKYKRSDFTSAIWDRLKDAEIFCRDAIDLIKIKDHEDTFFYLDPPYAESNCGHYEEGKDVYYKLLALLPTLKGKWLMSSYPSEQLTNLRQFNRWKSKDIVQNLSVSGKNNEGKTKTECLTWNYNLPQSLTLFEFPTYIPITY